MGRRELFAAIVILVVGGPMAFMLAVALKDGLEQHHVAPRAAMLGQDIYDKLLEGERTSVHYIGNEFTAPDFTLKDKDGNAWTLSDHKGKLVVMNFWSITCPPCVKEMPTLEELAQMAEEWDDVEVVAVSTDAGWDAVSTIMPEDPTLKVLFDPDKSVVEGKYGTKLYPETWLVDARGVIRFRYDGGQDWSSALAVDVIETFR